MAGTPEWRKKLEEFDKTYGFSQIAIRTKKSKEDVTEEVICKVGRNCELRAMIMSGRGNFLNVAVKDRGYYPSVKFDLYFRTKENPEGIIIGDALYDLVGQLIGLSRKTDATVRIKPIHHNPGLIGIELSNNHRMFLHDSIHVYCLLKNGGQRGTNHKLRQFYRAARKIWGGRFCLNPHENQISGAETEPTGIIPLPPRKKLKFELSRIDVSKL